MNALPLIMLAALCVLTIGYVALLLGVSREQGPRRSMTADLHLPASAHPDGHNFVPTGRVVLFGHHFSPPPSRARGRFIGPVLACQYGYAPGFRVAAVGRGPRGSQFTTSSPLTGASIRHGGRTDAALKAGPRGDLAPGRRTGLDCHPVRAGAGRRRDGLRGGELDEAGCLGGVHLGGLDPARDGHGPLDAARRLACRRPGLGGRRVLGLLLAVWIGGALAGLDPMPPHRMRVGLRERLRPQPASGSGDRRGRFTAFFGSVLPVWLLLEPRDYLSTYMEAGDDPGAGDRRAAGPSRRSRCPPSAGSSLGEGTGPNRGRQALPVPVHHHRLRRHQRLPLAHRHWHDFEDAGEGERRPAPLATAQCSAKDW